MRLRGEIIVLLLIVTVILTLAVLARRESPASGEPEKLVHSSYRTLPEGYKALYSTLQELGYPVQRLVRPYVKLPAHGLLIVADPYLTPVSDYEGRELTAWLSRGNTALLILAEHPDMAGALIPHSKAEILHMGDSESSSPLQRHAAEEESEGIFTRTWWHGALQDKPSLATPVIASFLSRTAPELYVQSPYRFPARQPLPERLAAAVGGAVPLYHDRFGVAVAYSAVGAGGIVWCCSPWSFANAGLPKGHNLDFVLALANLQPEAPVIFDEYHHGIGTGVSLWTLAPTVTKWGLVQSALALALLLVLLAWRFGPPRLPLDERFTRTRAEYLTSMAGLLQRVQATHVVRDRLANLLRRQLSRRLGIPPQADFTLFLTVNAQLHAVEQQSLERIIAQMTLIEQQPRPDEYVLLRLANDIQRLLYQTKGT